MTAHQRIISEQMRATVPRMQAPSLDGYAVETISRKDATPIIMHYEWLRSLGRTTTFVGLLSPAREIEGVACFGAGPGGEIMKLFGEPALCLERGACVHYAPRNAASFLINAACKLVYRITKVPLFFAYGDPMAFEYGGVYQAAGWLYLGQGLDGGKGRKLRYFVLQPGRNGNDPAAWQSTRELRRHGFRGPGSFAAARLAGWQISLRAGKHVYAIHVGRHRHRWRKQTATSLPYPSPDPTLKRKNLVISKDIFRIEPPDRLDSLLF